VIKINEATRAQNQAADPAGSTWVSANAGSGKTRVLTDRVARLLLQNVPPQKILCLTYTKAAASHMQNQLFDRLGSWAMLPDAQLRENLAKLGEDMTSRDATFLNHARTLFARALETPGGLKIQTIHSFCAALLRRFPLEAGVSPPFTEMDERSGKNLRAEILDTLADGPTRGAIDAMAQHLSGDDPEKLLRAIIRYRDGFSPAIQKSQIWALFDLPPDYDEQACLGTLFPGWADAVLRDLQGALLAGKTSDMGNAAKLAKIDWKNPSMTAALLLESMFVFDSDPKKKTPDRAKTSFPTKMVRDAHPDLMAQVDRLMEVFQDEKFKRQGLIGARKTHALHQFAQAFLPEFERRKDARAWLDFDDLILKARALLSDRSMTQWVLFKLDGGIDHILVDEAQDTSPAQWDVIARLAEEFSSGKSARETPRTLFVVGDEKQSIYSFQGADPDAFERMRTHFDTRLAAAQSTLNQYDLLFSFRSSARILELVDAMVHRAKDEFPARVTHRAFHETLPGRVDLWPFVPQPEKSEKPAWFDPVDTPSPDDPAHLLAGQIADSIAAIVASGEILPTATGPRPVAEGDFLILVQRRSTLFHAIIKALKDRKLPVAGADRLKLGGELAVRDLSALLSFMATPEDDLSLACVLRSPIFQLSEKQLFSLAYGRKNFLWEAIRNRKDDFPKAFDILTDLLALADYQRPFEMLERILTRHGARENLIARLGPEAEDGIDAMLAQALEYETIEPPSLTGFLGWMSTDESDIKRQMDTKSGQIRVMTVHGAKGLESPIVILPDTAWRKPPLVDDILAPRTCPPIWTPTKPDRPPLVCELVGQREAFLKSERMRLLYVAMTRAENWLIVCGAGKAGKPGESWYNLIAEALGDVSAATTDFYGREIMRTESPNWRVAATKTPVETPVPLPDVPDWARSKAPAVRNPIAAITPSGLGGAKIIYGAADGQPEEVALARGSLIHKMLQHFPNQPTHQWSNIALKWGAEALILDSATIASAVSEVSAILTSTENAFLFAADSMAEVALTARLDGVAVDAVIDRLIVTHDQVLAVDFKSNAIPAQTPDRVPGGLLRQMGAYKLVLEQIYPGREVQTAILWTRTAQLMMLPHKIVTDALSQLTAS